MYLQPNPFGGAPVLHYVQDHLRPLALARQGKCALPVQVAYAKAPGSLNRYAAPGVSTFPTVGSVPTRGGHSARQRNAINLVTDWSFLSGATWYIQQAGQQMLDYGAEWLAERSLVRFSVRASRHKLLTRLPQAAVELLGGTSVIQNLSANYERHTLHSGLRLVQGQPLSSSVFDDLVEVVAGDGRSTRWQGTVDDYFGHSFAWMSSRWFGVASAMGVEVLFQWFWPGSGDVWNYEEYGLTPTKFAGRTVVAAGGGLFTLGVVEGATVVFGSLSLGSGALIAIGAAAFYEMLIKPNLYKWFDLHGADEH